MKAMVCEMCQSSDLVKQNDLYVCQYCGTKYSVEAARKLIVEGVVKLDNSNKLNSLYKAARRAMNDKNYNVARDYYKKILQEDPVSWEATLFCKHIETDQYPRIGLLWNLSDTSNIVLGLIQDNVTNYDERNHAVKVVLSHVLSSLDYYIKCMIGCYDCSQTRNSDGVEIDAEILNDRRRNFANDWNYIREYLSRLFMSIRHFPDLDPQTSNEICDEIRTLTDKLDVCKSQYYANNAYPRGCYIATCIYGSYDCPEVWVLRRFRDNTLKKTWYGRTFIRIYYATSPTLVKWFGNTTWFKEFWRPTLDQIVTRLNKNGIDNAPYKD